MSNTKKNPEPELRTFSIFGKDVKVRVSPKRDTWTSEIVEGEDGSETYKVLSEGHPSKLEAINSALRILAR